MTHIIAGGIGQRAIALFQQQGIEVFYGALQKKPEDLVLDFLNNTLVTFQNKCDH